MAPQEFLDTANDLVTGIRQGDWRSAVSRAYYTVFHFAQRLLRGLGFRPPDSDRVHGYLWLRLGNCGHKQLAAEGQAIFQLRKARNWADYNLHLAMEHQTACEIVDRAILIIDLLRLVEKEPSVLAQITQTMRDYERDVLKEVTWKA